ncbi:hypothetical protein ACEWY4_027894 [Coilia grayii]|uniref:SET domain-containing protein n=1 Tax=Coilia grayii TaxID=363190 RepID=A0ABD1IPH1_9TELE
MFDFMWHGKKWCIDAAMEDGSLGRLANDDHVCPNCRMKRILVDGKPHLCLFAAKDIHRGEEITYDYGDNNWPWREKGGGDSPDIAVENHILPFSSNLVMHQKEASPSSFQGGGDSPDIAVENHILPCSSNLVMHQKEASPSSFQGGGDSPDIAVENHILPCSSNLVMHQKEASPSSFQMKENIPDGYDYRGSDCIRQLVQHCDVKNPLSLTSTRLRKHMATLSKVLNLQKTELDHLADFMGHDIRVHRQFYWLPEGTLQLVKISEILMAMEQGHLAEFQGKSLEQIDIDPNETIQLDKHPESEDDLAEVACGQDMEVPDVSQPQKQKFSADSDGDEMPLQKTKSVPDASQPQKQKFSADSDEDDMPLQKSKTEQRGEEGRELTGEKRREEKRREEKRREEKRREEKRREEKRGREEKRREEKRGREEKRREEKRREEKRREEKMRGEERRGEERRGEEMRGEKRRGEERRGEERRGEERRGEERRGEERRGEERSGGESKPRAGPSTWVTPAAHMPPRQARFHRPGRIMGGRWVY